jgi:hypothetical protein
MTPLLSAMLRFLPLLALLLAAPAFAQADLAGDWSGTLDLSEMQPDAPPLTVIVHMVRDGDGYSATFDSPTQGVFGIPVDSVSLDGQALTVAMPDIRVTYTGTVSADGSQIDGTWTQGPASLPLVLTPYEAPAPAAAATPKSPKARGDYSGDWVGSIQLDNGGEMRLTFHLTRRDDGGYDAAASAPAQGADHLELGQATVQGRSVTIPVPPAQAEFSGTISDDETQIAGDWKQGGEKLPMVLQRQ